MLQKILLIIQKMRYQHNPVHTPNINTIDDVCSFFNTTQIKLVGGCISKESDNKPVVLFIREIMRLMKLAKEHFGYIYPAEINNEHGLSAGFRAYKLDTDCEVLFDRSLENTNTLLRCQQS